MQTSRMMKGTNEKLISSELEVVLPFQMKTQHIKSHQVKNTSLSFLPPNIQFFFAKQTSEHIHIHTGDNDVKYRTYIDSIMRNIKCSELRSHHQFSLSYKWK